MSNNNKKIAFNTSTLFSLKAELLRKQEEVSQKKRLPQHNVELHKPSSAKALNKNESSINEDKKSFKANLLAEVDSEELEACRRAKKALEKKAELYNHLSDTAGRSDLSSRYLVDFDNKKQQDVPAESESDEAPDMGPDIEDDEWTEFTDCLGRTRKCLKSDLEFYIKNDKELSRSNGLDETVPENREESKSEKPLLVQKTNDYLQSLRQKWEEKEKELLAKDKDIHYQDVLFDEARIHGVGYYSFSTDETERRKQMEDLMRSHEEALAAQKKAEAMRSEQEKLLAARVAATRARRRARAGLPPEDPKDDRQEFTEKLLQFLQQQRDEAENKAKEKEMIIREKEEKERKKLREAHVRDWDIGKEGVDDKLKKFRLMTQEEYVGQQRNKRIDEFAPPQAGSSSKSYNGFDETGRKVNNDNETYLPPKQWADVRPRPKTPPPPVVDNWHEVKGLYFSTNKKTVKYKNFVPETEIEPTPIVNEISEDEDENNKSQTKGKRKADNIKGNHAEIEPPPTYDYYGPTPKHFKPKKPFNSDIREAYAQGAKSLENKSKDLKLPSHYDFTFD